MGRKPEGRSRWGIAVAFVLALLLVFGVTACGGGSSTTGESGGGGESAEAPESGEEGTGGESEETGGESEASGEPILIGLALAKTGALSPYDLQPGKALELSLKKINEEGGADGREIKTSWIDTKSSKTLAASVATEELNEGAVAIISTCDFDYGSPAAFVAKAANVPGISICASSPKNATPAIIGELGFSMGTGSDTEGVTAAEWAMNEKHWKSVYILRDTSLEYSKATTDYFKKRWEELGGEVVGEDEFVGGENADISAQATRAKSAAANAEFVYIGSWNPAGSVAARQLREAGVQLPIVANQSSDGLLTSQVAGNISDYYSLPLACMPAYCTGEGPNQKEVDKFSEEFEAAYHEKLSNSYPINGYDLGRVLKQAIEKAGGDEPEAIGKAITTMGPVEGLTSKFEFTEGCHRPVGQSRVIIQWTNGKAKYLSTLAPKLIPDIGDANPCTGPQKTFTE